VQAARNYTEETAPEAPSIDLPPQMQGDRVATVPALATGGHVAPPDRSSPVANQVHAVKGTTNDIGTDALAGDSNAFVGDVR
jgi:hypothetical protein